MAMASSTLCSGAEVETGGVVLPFDVIYKILIRLPAEELCRLRVVCQQWESLLSDAQFIAAHAARHQLPLIVADPDDGILCRIIDLSGRVIKQIRLKKSVNLDEATSATKLLRKQARTSESSGSHRSSSTLGSDRDHAMARYREAFPSLSESAKKSTGVSFPIRPTMQ